MVERDSFPPLKGAGYSPHPDRGGMTRISASAGMTGGSGTGYIGRSVERPYRGEEIGHSTLCPYGKIINRVRHPSASSPPIAGQAGQASAPTKDKMPGRTRGFALIKKIFIKIEFCNTHVIGKKS